MLFKIWVDWQKIFTEMCVCCHCQYRVARSSRFLRRVKIVGADVILVGRWKLNASFLEVVECTAWKHQTFTHKPRCMPHCGVLPPDNLNSIYCILSYTGWTSRSGSCTSLLWWSTDVSRTRRRSICRTTACQSLKLPVVSNCDLPLVISFHWSHDIISEHLAVGLFLWLARRSGTHWQMNCELTLLIVLN